MQEELNCKFIYETLNDFVYRNYDSIYKNQDFENSGKFDVEQFLMGEELPMERKYSLSRELIFCIDNYLECPNEDELVDFLDENKLILYYFTFYEMISAYVNDGFIDRLTLSSIAEQFITKSNEESLIKLGITLLGIVDKEKAKDYGRVLGILSEYTFFVVYSVKNSKDENTFILTYSRGLMDMEDLYVFKIYIRLMTQ